MKRRRPRSPEKLTVELRRKKPRSTSRWIFVADGNFVEFAEHNRIMVGGPCWARLKP